MNSAGRSRNAPEPVFIVGAMRSGTTLLRFMLNEHSELAIPSESHFLLPLFRDFGPARELSGDDLDRALTLVTGSSEWRRDYKHTAAELREAVGSGPLSMSELIDRVFRLEIADTGKPRWGDKTPQNLFRVSDLLACFPRAKVVAMVRDPRDVYLSLFGRDWVGDSCWEIGRYIAQCDALVTRWQRRFSAERFTCVRYEDLVLEPEVTLKRVCRFASLEFEPGMLEFHKRASKTLNNWEVEVGAHTKLLRPMQASDVERWRDQRSPSARLQMAQIEAFTYEQMTEFGYVCRYPAFSRAPARASAHLAYRLAKLRHDPAKVVRTVTRSVLQRRATPVHSNDRSVVSPTLAGGEARTFEERLAENNRGFAVDVVDPCAPTVVAFGGVGGGVGGVPHYEFFRVLDGLQINRVFVRDLNRRFYHQGVRGLGATFEDVAKSLEVLLPAQTERVVLVGSSVGGFAAIIFGALIGVDHVIALGPVTFIDRWRRLKSLDRRWPSSVNAVNRGLGVKRAYLDVCGVLRARPAVPRVDVYFSLQNRLDALHARRLKGITGVSLYPLDSGGDEVARVMRDTGALREILEASIRGN